MAGIGQARGGGRHSAGDGEVGPLEYRPSGEMPGSSRAWGFSQCFGEREMDDDFSEADLLSAVEFNETGDYLATGDKGGRIVIFERTGSRRRSARKHPADEAGEENPAQYRFYTEFQSHEAEFDYLKSQDIEEKINQIAWCRGRSGALFLLSTNDKTIKLWKVSEHRVRQVVSRNVETGRFGAQAPVRRLVVPQLTTGPPEIVATPRRVFSSAHSYHINSLSVNSDGEHFLSGDDLRINLWSLEHQKISFNVVDIKPENMEDLTEVITAARFHPQHCHMLIYSSSRGTVKLGDMRRSALCDRHAKQFEDTGEDPSGRSYFSEIIASISDVRFSPDGNYILARDFMSVKAWDMRMEARPVMVLPVHEHLRPRLGTLYDNDCIFDKFEVSCSGDGTGILTGSYSNGFRIFDTQDGTETSLALSKLRPVAPVRRSILDVRNHDAMLAAQRAYRDSELNFAQKVLHYSWHPKRDAIAVAGLNSLYIFNADRGEHTDDPWGEPVDANNSRRGSRRWRRGVRGGVGDKDDAGNERKTYGRSSVSTRG